jgi:hypothetical protein
MRNMVTSSGFFDVLRWMGRRAVVSGGTRFQESRMLTANITVFVADRVNSNVSRDFSINETIETRQTEPQKS